MVHGEPWVSALSSPLTGVCGLVVNAENTVVRFTLEAGVGTISQCHLLLGANLDHDVGVRPQGGYPNGRRRLASRRQVN